MSHQSSLPLIMTIAVLWVVTAIGCASKAAPPPSSATIVSVKGAATTYQSRDWNGKSVTVRVPSQSSADIKGMDTQGSVRATVTAIDPTANHVQVRTSEGQTVVLAMSPATPKDLRVGDPLLFTEPKGPQ